MVFQDPYASLNPRWRALDIVAEPIRAFGIAQSDAETAPQVGDLLKLVGLDPADGTKISARIFRRPAPAHRDRPRARLQAEFIVCDEPTSALDVSVQAQILNLMRDLQDKFGLTYLFISHNLAVVRHMANRIGVMYLGRLVEVAPARELFRKPKHPYTRMLLDAVPDLDLTGRQRKPVEGEVPNPVDPPPGCPFHPRCPFAFERCRVERPLALPAGARRSPATRSRKAAFDAQAACEKVSGLVKEDWYGVDSAAAASYTPGVRARSSVGRAFDF